MGFVWNPPVDHSQANWVVLRPRVSMTLQGTCTLCTTSAFQEDARGRVSWMFKDWTGGKGRMNLTGRLE